MGRVAGVSGEECMGSPCMGGREPGYLYSGGRVGQNYPSDSDWHDTASWQKSPSRTRGKADRPPKLMRGSKGARMRSARRLRAQTKTSARARTRCALPVRTGGGGGFDGDENVHGSPLWNGANRVI